MCLLTTCGKVCGIPSGGIRRVFGVTLRVLNPYGKHYLRPLNPYGNVWSYLLNPYGNVRSYSDLGPQSIMRPQKCQPPGEKNLEIRTKKIIRTSWFSYIRCWQTQRFPLYYTSKPHTFRAMVSYLQAQKQKVRITLELNVFQDFNARDIDFERLFDLEPGESVESYIEEFDRTWHWEGSICPCKVS